MRPRCGPWPPMNMPNGMRPPMRGRGGGPGPGPGPGGPMRGMGPRPPYPGMGPPMRHFGPPPMGPRGGPHNRGGGHMMHRMRPPPPHMMPPMMRPPRPMRPPMKKTHKIPPNNDGKVKKKKLKFRSFYATRPWVNDELRAEITKKDQLFDAAKKSHKADDWAAFKEQKDKCVHMYSALKLEFIGQHPEEVFSSEEDGDEEDEYLCEPCDRTFDEEGSFREHLREHQTCGIDGCQFNAHEMLVLAHIKMQHSSGLYDKIRNISTPEDIEKWRAQRKKNYPSKANIEQRYKQQEEMLKRGERIGPNKDRFGRVRNPQGERREKQKLARKKKKKQPQKKPEEAISLIDEKADWNGTMFPFKGTKSLLDEESDDSQEAFSDDEWDCNDVRDTVEEPVLNNALGALMGAYQSDSDDEHNAQTTQPNKLKQNTKQTEMSKPNNENVPSTSTSTQSPVEVNANASHIDENDDDQNTEVKILKEPVNLPDKATEMRTIERKRAVPVTATPEDLADMPIPPKKVKAMKKPPPPKARQPRRPTLLQKLLDKEIRHERNVILQCVRHVVNNNFFKDTDKDKQLTNHNYSQKCLNIDENAISAALVSNVNVGASTSTSGVHVLVNDGASTSKG